MGCDSRIAAAKNARIPFQSTHPYGMWLNDFPYLFQIVHVSIHTSLWDVTLLKHKLMDSARLFQSTHPYGMWLLFQSRITVPTPFQSTHPYGMWLTWFWPVLYAMTLFQSTHPYGMWRCSWNYACPQEDVSIHTSLWDVTCHTVNGWAWIGVSIHTSLWDVTYCSVRSWPRTDCFNPHIPMGCDDASLIYVLKVVKFQSTHPYGMWQTRRWSRCRVSRVSIHTSLWDVTGVFHNDTTTAKFQSTHPYGMWRGQTHPVQRIYLVSIHTSLWDVTMSGLEKAHNIRVSIHTSLWDVTEDLSKKFYIEMFQSTHPYGMWPKTATKKQTDYIVSIHTSLWDVTL